MEYESNDNMQMQKEVKSLFYMIYDDLFIDVKTEIEMFVKGSPHKLLNECQTTVKLYAIN